MELRMKNEYIEKVLQLRKQKALHSEVEKRLSELLQQSFPNSIGVSEISGVLGGRNDLIHFQPNGIRTVFEIFASKSQVSQDLRLLEQCDAQRKIAVLIDHDADPSVSNEYFRKKPDSYPFFWLRDVLDNDWEKISIVRLREVIDEKYCVNEVRKLLEGNYGENVDHLLRKVISEVKTKLPPRKNSKPIQVSGLQILALKVIKSINKMGIPMDRLRSLYQWLELSMKHAFTIASSGIHALLVTDLESEHAIWSDGDLADVLLICPDENLKPQIVVSLNSIINSFLEENNLEPFQIRLHFFHSYFEFIGEQSCSSSKEKPPALKEKTKKKNRVNKCVDAEKSAGSRVLLAQHPRPS
ncbi:MAG: hypothetical protein WDA26_12600, partial [Pusillimonas sp.]